jgi:hypothetical protein
MKVNQGMFEQIQAAGVEPTIEQKPGFVELTYRFEDADGPQTLTRPFWRHGGSWVTYDPQAES